MTTLAPQPIPNQTPGRYVLPRTDPVTRLPLLILYPHSRCNCRCLMCDIWRSTTREEIAPSAVARWLDEWRDLGVQRVVLSGGEALMHRQLWELCTYLKQADIGVTLLSTGLLLQRHADRIAEFCDDVVVSLDGSADVHDRIRNVPRAFDRLARGVASVSAAAATRGTVVALSGRCTVQKQNYQNLCAVVRAAREIGLSRISFLAADVSTDAFNRPAGWDDDHVGSVALGSEDLPLLQAELDRLERDHAADFATGFIAESPLKLRRRLHQYYAALLGQGEFYPNACNAPWVSTVIEADGTVRPCFFQPPLGNLHQAGNLRAILNSPQSRAWRGGLDPHRDAICRKCVCTVSLQSAPSAHEYRNS
ncbi:MAG: radical SAM protein [Steroidobacteraceae bacterium]